MKFIDNFGKCKFKNKYLEYLRRDKGHLFLMEKPRVIHTIITEEAIQWTESYSDTRAYKCYQAASSLVPEIKTSNFSIRRGCKNMLCW